MSLLTFQQTKSMDFFCQKLLSDTIHFAVILNSRGKVVAGQSGDSDLDEGTKQMTFMSLVLEMSMRKELNHIEGEIEYIAAKRKNRLVISVPINENLLVLFTNPEKDPAKILEYVKEKQCFGFV